jgi:hypothetical protein
MVSANDLEKKVLVEDLIRLKCKSHKEVIDIASYYNHSYTGKIRHNKNYLCSLHGEVLHIEAEKYNMEKAEVFERWVRRFIKKVA